MKKLLIAMATALTGSLLMADALQDALDNTNLVFEVDGEDAYWNVVESPGAKGGSCLKLGPLNSGYSVDFRAADEENYGPGAWLFRIGFAKNYSSTRFWVSSSDREENLWPYVGWQNMSVPGSEYLSLSMSLDADEGWDGQACYIDNVRWVASGDVLCPEMEFSIDDGWYVESDSNGELSLCSYGFESESERLIQTWVSGQGTIRFKSSGYRYYGEGDYEFGVIVDGEVLWSKCFSAGEYLNWNRTIDVPVLTKDEHEVIWYVRNNSEDYIYDGQVGISNVEWIPAPEILSVSFDGEGGLVDGKEKSTRTFVTGECYGVLPTPVREGRTFEGWFTPEGENVVASDYAIPLATNLFAHWSVELDGSEGDVVKGNDGIYSDKDGIVFPLSDTWWYDANNYFEVTCAGETIVSFDWVIEADASGGDGRYSTGVYHSFYVDGEIIEDNSWSAEGRDGVRAFLTPGNHTLRWQVPFCYGSVPVRCAVENFKVEPVKMQTDIVDWVNLLTDFRVWKPDNLAYLRDNVYKARVASDPTDYEARVILSAIRLALLAENKEIRKFIQECGWTIEDYTMKVSGEFCGLKNLAPANEIVERLSPEVLAVIDEALADLDEIPENWNGTIALTPRKYRALDETVYVDMAEITMLKALLESIRASVLLVKGYDFTMDYVTVSNAVMNAEFVGDILDQAPAAGSIRDANVLLESKEWFKKSLQHIRRADQIIQWRTDPLPHFFEYDMVDADNLARSRLYVEKLIGSLDHPETIDLPYFADKFGYDGETLPMGMFRQLYLGAVFAGRVTRDIVPEIGINRETAHTNWATLYMDSMEDTTFGGLLPDFGFEEFAMLFPCNQYWSLDLYDEYHPQSRLLKNQTLTVAAESVCDGTLEYTANLERLKYVTAQCVVDGLAVDTICVEDEAGTMQNRAVAIPNGSKYDLVFTVGDHSMAARKQVFEITSVPEVSPVGDGTYTQTINGVTWSFTVSDDEATITGVSGAITGDLSIPEKLGGRVVTAIGDKAFMETTASTVIVPSSVKTIGKGAFLWCENLKKVTFLGAEPSVGKLAFEGVTAAVVFKGGTKLSGVTDGKWQGMTVQYVDDASNEDLRVCASLPDGYEFNGMATLTLSVSGDATIFFTMNGADPTTNALVYSSPISVSLTTRIKYYAVDNKTGDSGPVGSVLLKLVSPDSALLSTAEYSKTVNGISWSYQECADGVRLTGNNGTSSGEKVSGAVIIPDAINWQPVTTVGAGLFASCEGVTSVRIPATVTGIEREAFKGCTRLESVTLPDGLLSIADGAFERCTSLTSVVIPSTVTNIGYFAFRDCLRLTDVTLKGNPPRQDLGVYMGVPAFTTISGRMGSATAIVYAGITNKSDVINVPESWLDELAVAHDKPAGAESYQAAFKAKYGDDLKVALTKPTGKHDLKGNPLYVWQDYVAGTDPLDEEDEFTATITMENGVPVVRWSPELTPEAAAKRKYTVYGATALDGTWDDVSDLSDEQRHDRGYQFFSVTVELK